MSIESKNYQVLVFQDCGLPQVSVVKPGEKRVERENPHLILLCSNRDLNEAFRAARVLARGREDIIKALDAVATTENMPSSIV